MSENKLPADPMALVLGIVALFLCVGGCCLSTAFFPFAIFAIVPVVLSIIGILVANRSLKTYAQNPEIYSQKSKENVFAAKIVNIVTLIFAGLIFLSIILGVVSLATTFNKFFDGIDIDKEYPYQTEEIDTIYDYEVEKDSLLLDSIFIEEFYPETDTLNKTKLGD